MPINLNSVALYPAPIRLVVFVLALLAIWVPFALPIYLLLGSRANLVTILTMVLLYIEFIFLVRWWGKKIYKQPNLLKTYGLEWTRINGIYLVKGLSIGLLFCLSLFLVEGVLGWLAIQPSSGGLIRVIAEGLLSAIGVGFAEELLFRGWLLDELKRDYSWQISLWTNSLIFALLHFIKPISDIIDSLPQFPALVLLGLALVWGKRKAGARLGMPIGLHAGLVWGYYIVNIGKLIEYTDKVPIWMTGINGNPLAGVMGLLFMGILATWMKKKL